MSTIWQKITKWIGIKARDNGFEPEVTYLPEGSAVLDFPPGWRVEWINTGADKARIAQLEKTLSKVIRDTQHNTVNIIRRERAASPRFADCGCPCPRHTVITDVLP